MIGWWSGAVRAGPPASAGASRAFARAARELDEDTLARRRRVLGKDHPDTLTSASNLAADLRRLGDLDAAKALKDEVAQRDRSGRGRSPGQAQ